MGLYFKIISEKKGYMPIIGRWGPKKSPPPPPPPLYIAFRPARRLYARNVPTLNVGLPFPRLRPLAIDYH